MFLYRKSLNRPTWSHRCGLGTPADEINPLWPGGRSSCPVTVGPTSTAIMNVLRFWLALVPQCVVTPAASGSRLSQFWSWAGW